jgi:hypothetical protein
VVVGSVVAGSVVVVVVAGSVVGGSVVAGSVVAASVAAMSEAVTSAAATFAAAVVTGLVDVVAAVVVVTSAAATFPAAVVTGLVDVVAALVVAVAVDVEVPSGTVVDALWSSVVVVAASLVATAAAGSVGVTEVPTSPAAGPTDVAETVSRGAEDSTVPLTNVCGLAASSSVSAGRITNQPSTAPHARTMTTAATITARARDGPSSSSSHSFMSPPHRRTWRYPP